MSRFALKNRSAWALFALLLLPSVSYSQSMTHNAQPSDTPPKGNDPQQKDCGKWSIIGKPQLAAGASQSKTSSQTYKADIKPVRTWYKDDKCLLFDSRIRMDINPSFAGAYQTGKLSLTTAREFGSIQYIHSTPSSALFYSLEASGYHNNNLGIYFQQDYGLGGAYVNNKLELDADLRYIGEHFYKAEKALNLVGVQLSESYELAHSNRLFLLQTISLTPVLNKAKATQARAGLSLTVPIFNTSWNLNFPIDDDFMQNAPRGYRQNYFSISLNLANLMTVKTSPK